MNEKCAACIHCEVCGFIESEVARGGACDFYEDGKKWEPCEDAISRDAVCNIVDDIRDCISVEGYWAILERLKKLPPVTPQPKTGHWIRMKAYEKWGCSECSTVFRFTFKEHNYCPNCGAKMEVEE